MNAAFPPDTQFINCVDCQATMARLIGNISGFVYRRRLDPRRTMDFVSPGCRDITGYDPHRFIGNASFAYGGLIARSDWKRINGRIRLAAQHRQRAAIEYMIRTVHGAWTLVEDRLTPVVNATGQVLAIDGIIDGAQSSQLSITSPRSPADVARLAALCSSPSSN
jgi:PAS domain-containing protein